MGFHFTPKPDPSGTSTGTPSPAATASPSAAPPRDYPLQLLRDMLARLHAIDGPAASLMDDAQLKKLLQIQALGSTRVTSDPAECKDLLQAGSFSDDRIPTAAAKLGPAATVTVITAASDASGLYRKGMDSLQKAAENCSPATLTEQGHTISVRMTLVAPDLHGREAVGLAQTLTAEGSTVNLLRIVGMDGNLFITATKTIPTQQPEGKDIRELVHYVNEAFDNAANTPSSPKSSSTGVTA
ncbi:hypothetical protein [Arthrobacter bambusae]|uniref:DUF222 domain-containing protein n=1 Tax=Arthrobacter bambusae TaxID=1338426 RepID=A0AAW8D5W3_9MICC|nr:hypothetical protein [Arthrobacter bambusae]MDP9903095.1 hypothetical protein [Arthrobacter bambusae]MDQ0128911.1 hypothetical protein [Arthrobacter bambusae]MDQ0180252.1 hypothetical protein [Arthrobacter bambusae]